MRQFQLDLAQWLAGALSSLPDWLVTVIISMTPFVELRLGLPWAILHYNMDWKIAFVFSVIGNIIPIPFIMLFFSKVERWLRKYPKWEKWMDKFFNYTRKRANTTIEKYEVIGLWLYVAIPLPVTGAWTGALIAYLFDLDIRRSFCSISAGVLTAGLIVLFITLGVINLVG